MLRVHDFVHARVEAVLGLGGVGVEEEAASFDLVCEAVAWGGRFGRGIFMWGGGDSRRRGWCCTGDFADGGGWGCGGGVVDRFADALDHVSR